MFYQLAVSKRVRKEVEKLPQQVRVKIASAFDVLSQNPFQGKKLEGQLKGYYSLRAWPFRIIYKIIKQRLVVEIIKVDHRKDVYK